MREFRPSLDAPPPDRTARYSIRDRILVGLVLLTLVRSGEALAGDQAAIVTPPESEAGHLPHGSPMTATAAAPIATPEVFDAPIAVSLRTNFSATDFRPRKHTVFDADPAVSAFADVPMLRGSTVWQRMADYRSHDGVRLLTLWESHGSTVSLQAGKRGDPSLQWTSNALNRGGSTRGLLDRWFSVTLADADRSLHRVTHSAGAPAPAPARVPLVAELK